MLEFALIATRLLQYAGAAILFGSLLFLLYALPAPRPRWERKALRWLPVAGAATLAASAAAGLAVQASLLAGSFGEGLTFEAVSAVVAYFDLGKAAAVRALAAGVALVCLLAIRAPRTRWVITAIPATVAIASLGWMGHAAGTEGPLGTVHLANNVLHVLAAGLWIGALAGFVAMLFARLDTPEDRQSLHRALLRFSGVGSALVALLVLTGFVNGWILIGPDRLGALWSAPYGRLLVLKLALFAGMVGLAAANRFRFTPMLASGSHKQALRKLRRSVGLEIVAGMAVLFLVAWLGTLEPPAFD